ncbi:MAG: aminotransferase class V-fold PLP-dependent enzyme [Actinomycetales bacterium]|nr:aminotransferase class V-fold PLP-dependent enzyme [Actinomycetales bacterium]
MHGYDAETENLAQAVLRAACDRLRLDPAPLNGSRSLTELEAEIGDTVTEDGLGLRALDLFTGPLSRACISTDHPRFLAFVPCAPTEAAMLFDLLVGVSSVYGGSWLEGAGAVFAENQALRWLADLAGLPSEAGGVFVPGATVGTLSALVTARHRARAGTPAASGRRGVVAASANAHSSVAAACEVMDVDLVDVPVDAGGRMTGESLRRTVAGIDGLFAVVATAGTTNLGIVDDLAGAAEVCGERGAWLHVDGAYGAAGLAAPSVRGLFDGVERADSLVVDPHKWLFAPYDCCALLYREPEAAREAHTQRAGYLDILAATKETNPADLAVGLTRRARGLPFWFSVAVNGTRAYTRAVERTLELARFAADEVRRRPHLELIAEPDLSVVAFRRLGWSPEQYHVWSDRLLLTGFAFVVPTTYGGETVTRLAVVNPRTTEADISSILDTMA